MKDLCILIPSYNEGKTIGGIVEDVIKRGFRAVIIDDGSTDNTAQAAESAGGIVLKHPSNRGKGASIRQGFDYVLKEGLGSALIMDGDGQHETSDINKFITKADAGEADIIIGNRMLDTSSMPAIRKITNKFMSYMISRLCRQNIPDSQCGFRLIKRRVLETVELESSNYEIESELLIKAARKGYRIGSVPIKTVYSGEVSYINPVVDTMRFFALIFRMCLK